MKYLALVGVVSVFLVVAGAVTVYVLAMRRLDRLIEADRERDPWPVPMWYSETRFRDGRER